MSFDPQIHFQGSCRAAMTFYRDILGGTPEVIGNREAPDAPVTMQSSNLVMHSSPHLSSRKLLASDFPPGHAGQPQAAVTISHAAPKNAEVRRLIVARSDGGAVMME